MRAEGRASSRSTARAPASHLVPQGSCAWPKQSMGERAFNPLTERLRRVGVPEAALAELEAIPVEVRSARPGDPIALEGAASPCLHILLEGWACRYLAVESGKKALEFLLPGDICDLDRLGAHRLEYGVCAITTCKVAVLNADRIRVAVLGEELVAAAVLDFAFEDHCSMMRLTASLGRRSARRRLANLICELQQRAVTAGIDINGSFLLPGTQEDIADILGLTAVHVNRTLTLLRSERLIRLEAHWLTILEPTELRRIAEYVPRPGHATDA